MQATHSFARSLDKQQSKARRGGKGRNVKNAGDGKMRAEKLTERNKLTFPRLLYHTPKICRLRFRFRRRQKINNFQFPETLFINFNLFFPAFRFPSPPPQQQLRANEGKTSARDDKKKVLETIKSLIETKLFSVYKSSLFYCDEAFSFEFGNPNSESNLLFYALACLSCFKAA